MSTRDFFDQNGYVVLTGALSKQECDQLTQHMFNLHDEGKLVKDDQCPESDAIYGDPAFDNLLAKFCEPIGQQVGRDLIPTYTYARIYRPGEILKKHKDRPSCEISATLTLGYDGKYVWPIYFDENKEIAVNLNQGELAVYKGCEIAHWRKPFKGNWHVQVFLHYVDANGPYKDHAFDGRPGLGHSAETKQQGNQHQNIQQINHLPKDLKYKRPVHDAMTIPWDDTSFPGFFGINSQNLPELMFTQEQCDKIIQDVEEAYPSSAAVGGGGPGFVNRQIRSADIFNIDNDEEHRWVWDKVGTIVSIANKIYYGYDLSAIEHSLQLIRYDSAEDIKGHYDWHVDAGPGDVATRKLSFTVQLSDPNTYKGCELLINDHGTHIVANKEKGSVNMFPSYAPHKVTPIEQGVRYALVIWVHGSRRFK